MSCRTGILNSAALVAPQLAAYLREVDCDLDTLEVDISALEAEVAALEAEVADLQSSCNCTVQRVSDLVTGSAVSGIPATMQAEGTMVWVQFEDAPYELVIDPTRIAAPLNTVDTTLTAVRANTTPAGPGGFWFRHGQAALRQTVYAVNQVTGDDNNLGLPAGVGVYGPLASYAEALRRIGTDMGGLPQPIAISHQTPGTHTENIIFDVKTDETSGATAPRVDITGTAPVVSATGTITAVVSTTSLADQTITSSVSLDAFFTAGLPNAGVVLRLTNGATVSYAQLISITVAGSQYRISPPARQTAAGAPAGTFVAPSAAGGNVLDVLTVQVIAGSFLNRSFCVVSLINLAINGLLTARVGATVFVGSEYRGTGIALLADLSTLAFVGSRVSSTSDCVARGDALVCAGAFFTGAGGWNAQGGGIIDVTTPCAALGPKGAGTLESYLNSQALGVIRFSAAADYRTTGTLMGLTVRWGGTMRIRGGTALAPAAVRIDGTATQFGIYIEGGSDGVAFGLAAGETLATKFAIVGANGDVLLGSFSQVTSLPEPGAAKVRFVDLPATHGVDTPSAVVTVAGSAVASIVGKGIVAAEVVWTAAGRFTVARTAPYVPSASALVTTQARVAGNLANNGPPGASIVVEVNTTAGVAADNTNWQIMIVDKANGARMVQIA